MISPRLQLMSGIALCGYFMVILYLLKKQTISLRYMLMWFFSGIVMGILIICPKILEIITAILGIQLISNAVFAMVLFFILIILLAITGIVSRLNEKNRQLAQAIAILEKKIREQEMK